MVYTHLVDFHYSVDRGKSLLKRILLNAFQNKNSCHKQGVFFFFFLKSDNQVLAEESSNPCRLLLTTWCHLEAKVSLCPSGSVNSHWTFPVYGHGEKTALMCS